MKSMAKSYISKAILITAIVFCASSHFFPWGEATALDVYNIQYYHWGGILLSAHGDQTSELILFPTNLSNATGTSDTYSYAAATLLLYLIIPLGIGSFALGLIALFRPQKNPRKRTFQAAITSFLSLILFITFMQIGVNPRFESGLAGFSSIYHWAIGFYLMIGATILYFTTHLLLRKYPTILYLEKTPQKKE
ncbi:MAG: hypothetical protein KKC68_06505 [Candidatus Thermoplasmatota archaeon]|nr:hypothetical protein [Candidatus Thermoplasmatota archaeon]MBU1941410.1 hypothetical protein [Candidatus Thermoplasmatota archaeon]